MRRHSTLIVGLALCAAWTAACRGQDTYQEEAGKLATLLKWQPGEVVAEIGAGDGRMTLAAAKFVSPGGKVYSTELDAKKLAHLEELAAKEKSLTVLKAGEAETNLPPACCDSIFMRLVYHHFTKPAEIDASLFQSLKPGGLLAVIDEEPRPGSSPPPGVPANRSGHGVPQRLAIEELTAAGFQVVTAIKAWPDDHYCVILRKSGP